MSQSGGVVAHAAGGSVAIGRADHVHVHLSRTRSNPRPDRPRPVYEWRAEQLGVHPAIHGANAPDDDGVFRLPEYLERDHDRRLRHYLYTAARGQKPMLVLVRGASCTGKTRTAFEAVQDCLPGWQLVFPKTCEGLLALLDTGVPGQRTVLWLNEAQTYLADPECGEETSAALRSRLEESGPIVILGTLWPEYHRALTATPRPDQDWTDVHPHARALLEHAVVVDVPASFAANLLEGPRVHRDPSLASAITTSTGGRITQTLAAGPQLVDHYQQPTEPHGPYGHAIITAAMDARRLGHSPHLPIALLEAAASGYLTERQRAAAPDGWFTHALAYAREPVRGVASALEPAANPDGMGALPGVFRLSDYLDHHARTARRYIFPPEAFWTAARDHATSAADLNALAHGARTRRRDRIAVDLAERAADAGEPSTLYELARSYFGAWGFFEDPACLMQKAADAGSPKALVKLIPRYIIQSDIRGAERLAERATELAFPYGLLELARWQERTGKPQEADRLFRKAADAGHPYSLLELARWRERTGNAREADRLRRQAADAGDPTALTELALQLDHDGDTEGAEQLAQRAADADGLYNEAGDLLHKAFDECEVRHGMDALILLAQRHQTRDPRTAARLWQRAADAGDSYALTLIGRWHDSLGDTEGAEQLALRAANTGNRRTMCELLESRVAAGDAESAERLAQQAASAGHFSALSDLAKLRERAGDVESAERLLQQAADAGDPSGLSHLAKLRERAGDLQATERLLQQAASAGHFSALSDLAKLRERAGDVESAERLLQHAVNAEDDFGFSRLVELRKNAGDPEGAEQMQRFGLEADGSPARPWW
ncbi:SEL1-like repeat protein [Streptomyces sp. OZ13]|uniref:SEL1-like repeat protein n=1 Tax=Streptomyces sp. OZ13 TaxID=3452210 RepID=UPI003F8B2887